MAPLGNDPCTLTPKTGFNFLNFHNPFERRKNHDAEPKASCVLVKLAQASCAMFVKDRAQQKSTWSSILSHDKWTQHLHLSSLDSAFMLGIPSAFSFVQ